jgi:hypothetical protein
MIWAEHAARTEDKRKAWGPFVSPRRRWNDNIKNRLRNVRKCGLDSCYCSYEWQDFVGTAVNIYVPVKTGNLLTEWMTTGLSRYLELPLPVLFHYCFIPIHSSVKDAVIN